MYSAEVFYCILMGAMIYAVVHWLFMVRDLGY